jgi:flagellar biosynthetic protein FliQ
MGPNDVLDVARDAIYVTPKVGAPIMLVALLVGLIVSLLQALTQI